MTGYSPYGAMAPTGMQNVVSPTAQPVGPLSGAAAAGRNAPAYDRRSNLPSANPNLDFAVMDGQQGYQFVTNRGKVADIRSNPSGFVALDPNAQYRLTNLRGEDGVVASGTGAQGLQDVYRTAQQLSAEGGKKAHWAAERLNPNTGEWERVAYDPRGGLKGALNEIAPIAVDFALLGLPGVAMGQAGVNVADVALPIAGAALGGPLGAAAGSALSSVAQGRGLKNTLLRAAISGGTAGLLDTTGVSSAIGRAASSALSPAAGSATGSAVGSALAPAIGDIIVTANPLTQAIASGVSGGLGSLAGSALPTIATPPSTTAPPADLNTITVTAPQTPTPSFAEAFAPFAGGAGLAGAGLAAAGGTPSTPTARPEDTITVTGERPLPTPDLSGILPAVAATPAAIAAATGGAGAQPEKPTDPNRSTLDEIGMWLQRAGLVSSVLGPLAEAVAGGGKGGGGNRNINAAGLGALNPIFSAQLPAANLPMRQPRDMSGTDWSRYGMGPERSFFTDVPQRLAKGGPAHSDGRSDDVPALLSRGEYVIDAETMALLGNGDPFAGADKMDEWRVNVRKHKGRQLMKGGISPDAKMPNQYMGGGRV